MVIAVTAALALATCSSHAWAQGKHGAGNVHARGTVHMFAGPMNYWESAQREPEESRRTALHQLRHDLQEELEAEANEVEQDRGAGLMRKVVKHNGYSSQIRGADEPDASELDARERRWHPGSLDEREEEEERHVEPHSSEMEDEDEEEEEEQEEGEQWEEDDHDTDGPEQQQEEDEDDEAEEEAFSRRANLRDPQWLDQDNEEGQDVQDELGQHEKGEEEKEKEDQQEDEEERDRNNEGQSKGITKPPRAGNDKQPRLKERENKQEQEQEQHNVATKPAENDRRSPVSNVPLVAAVASQTLPERGNTKQSGVSPMNGKPPPLLQQQQPSLQLGKDSELHVNAGSFDAFFDFMDGNRDGQVSSDEFLQVQRPAGQDDESTRLIYQLLDADKNGTLTPEELRQGPQLLHTVARMMIPYQAASAFQ